MNVPFHSGINDMDLYTPLYTVERGLGDAQRQIRSIAVTVPFHSGLLTCNFESVCDGIIKCF